MAVVFQAMEAQTSLPGERALIAMPEGVPGIAFTLNKMVEWARAFRTNGLIHNLASQIVAHEPARDYLGEAAAVQDFVKGTIRYTRDVFDVESLQTPVATFTRGQGDCDDQSLYVASLLLALGHEVRFKAIALDAPDAFAHVFCEMKYIRWVSVETTEDVPIGWLPDTPYPPMIRHV